MFPASSACPPGRVGSFTLRIPNRPQLDVIAVDLRKLAQGINIPDELLPPSIRPFEGLIQQKYVGRDKAPLREWHS